MSVMIQPVVIPDRVDIERAPNGKDRVSEEELRFFDKKTVFYDLFTDPAKEDVLVGLGPPLLNLASRLDGMRLVVDGKTVPYKWRDHPELKLSVLKAKLPVHHPGHGARAVELQFNEFSVTVDVGERGAQGRKVLAAISKDNKVSWVSEWVDHYRENFEIDDVFVYDNGSRNRGELKEALKGRAHVVDWDFPYGPPGKTHNKFAQAGALNHCLTRFARRGILYNFDIDELLISNKETLASELAGKGVVYFNSYNVPFVKPASENYTHKDFVYRFPELKATARKFVCKEDKVDVISQHATWKRSSLFLGGRMRRNKPDTCVSPSSYFLHFLGITTNWQPRLNKLEEVGTEGLVKDESHIPMMPGSKTGETESMSKGLAGER